MTPLPDSEALLAVAVAAVRAAGEHALRHRARRRDAISVSRHDVKLRLDVECQERATEVIRSRFPDHAILGEESPSPSTFHPPLDPRPSTLQWIIDPIDGTVNFSHGLPLWNSTVAVRMGDEILAGAVYAPLLNELYTATVDGPARCNGDIVHVSDTAGLAEAIVCSGMDKSPDTDIPPYTMVERFAANVQRVRILGSAALDLCQVARGAADGYWESGIYIWDVAAAGLIVRRAGGRAEILDRLDDGRLSFLASNAALYEPLQRLISGG